MTGKDLASPTPSADSPQQFDQDIYCADCGYNLRGLPLGATCPECGTPAEVSLRQDWISLAPLKWRRKIALGATLLWLGVVIAFPLIYPGLAVSFVGIMLLTAAQPGRAEPTSDRNSRLLARGLVTLAIAGLVVLLVMTGISMRRQGIHGYWQLYDGFFIGCHAVLALGLLTLWDYVQILAKRVPDPPLAKGCKRLWLCWIVAVSGIALVAGLSTLADSLLPGRLRFDSRNLLHVLIAAIPFLTVAALLVWLWLATLRVTGMLKRSLRAQTHPENDLNTETAA